ncbi:MAG: hypothetical protein KDD38_00615 [Bdellovibrionales bacterium]|nr:hypothetical protein [Bdellovibrionales bacterium]
MSFHSYAATSACETHSIKLDKYHLHTSLRSSGTCFLAIGSNYTPGLIYRDYLFTSDGQFMVFNSFGSGSASTDTGARVFYFAPMVSELGFDILGDEAIIHLPNGSRAVFNLSVGKFTHIDTGQIIESDLVSRDNRGGIEIVDYPGIYFDMGFAMGNSPVMQKKSMVKIVRPSQTCSVRMSKIFDYIDGEPVFQLTHESHYVDFMRRNCP